MNDAESKYNELKRDKIWDKPSDRQVIVALKTLLEKKSLEHKKKDKKSRKKKKERKPKGDKVSRKQHCTPKHKPDKEKDKLPAASCAYLLSWHRCDHMRSAHIDRCNSNC